MGAVYRQSGGFTWADRLVAWRVTTHAVEFTVDVRRRRRSPRGTSPRPPPRPRCWCSRMAPGPTSGIASWSTWPAGCPLAGWTVVTFNFLYIGRKRRAPDRAPVLEATWTRCSTRRLVRLNPKERRHRRQVDGGTHRVAGGGLEARQRAWRRVGGLVLLGYPAPSAGPARRPRVRTCRRFSVPILLVQGTRDTFGAREEIEPCLAR